jgi:hypothetical protein
VGLYQPLIILNFFLIFIFLLILHLHRLPDHRPHGQVRLSIQQTDSPNVTSTQSSLSSQPYAHRHNRMKMRKPVQVQVEDKEEDEEQEKDNEAFACYVGGTLSSVERCSFE